MDSSASTSTAVPETDPQIEHIIGIPDEIQPALHDLCCIYKVPLNLRKLNEGEAYEPILISIGPFHHNKKPELEPMHKQKQRYFKAFLRRVTNEGALAYRAFLSKNFDTIKHMYSEPTSLSKDEFVNMMLLDSVFIMELFLRKSNISEQQNDHIFTTPWICKSIQRDLLLLENQLPFYLLEDLYEIVMDLLDSQQSVDEQNKLSFLELAFKYFEDYYPHTSTPDKQNIVNNFSSCNHFTDLVRRFYLPEQVNTQDFIPCSTKQCVLKTATKLNEAGVSFEKVRHKSLLDIKLQKIPCCSWFLCLGCVPCFTCVKTRFQIPQLRVLQTTECVLRNLIALEQCHYPDQPFMCNYVSLIDSLIHSTEDVELLVDKGIIEHELGSHTELATMINGLCKHVEVNGNNYGNITSKLNDHYNSNWKHYMGVLRSVYFRDPWRITSTLVGVVIFLFAIFTFLHITGLYPKR
ncbi:UPF0481 protein At3g47200-like [Vigna unguiculata]|uniref:Uncharacterized protein n=1 Tax=Vigna unguiculata TaxID=3917 RepID=A0A4D6MTC7_VIGUN|nr:UPF0481 protein At3g47200-like [Vigna unguiculata]QCE04726.1 hypothetical protein DEO72_LG8g2764 [Vigna unguiculata]